MLSKESVFDAEAKNSENTNGPIDRKTEEIFIGKSLSHSRFTRVTLHDSEFFEKASKAMEES